MAIKIVKDKLSQLRYSDESSAISAICIELEGYGEDDYKAISKATLNILKSFGFVK